MSHGLAALIGVFGGPGEALARVQLAEEILD
jgi:hypothetical protein